ncbi:LysR family transcriptional regulator (plasmid) [Cupriavidus pinatubonensis]|uniref:LysR substrate-binding domain-containing protein n=1 Tax=Cupriavidus pinatubonensis TaxID=248026 RepID=UPI001C73B4BA|nr:LysR substrate-binding domain-containing protein [Cupriavidus pinatubonensis]QYY34280.1 LysR family transcriptional regulator [Cupriavidus pinatubonensis]
MIPPLTSLLAFEAIARRRSFALAAAELHLTPSAVSHQVARLEKLIGLRLFERTTRGVELTPAGQTYLQRVAGALGAINAATEDLRHGVEDALYLHSSPSFASLWLMPRIAGFARKYPKISLNLSVSPEISDFEVGQVDLDIRYGLPNWPDLEVEPAFPEEIVPLASESFLEAHRISSPGDLAHAPLIQSSSNLVQWPEWFAKYLPGGCPERMSLRFDRAMMSIDAAVQGLGIALESATLSGEHLANGRLRRVFCDGLALEVVQHFVVYPARVAARAEVLCFLDWLRGERPAFARPSYAARVSTHR